MWTDSRRGGALLTVLWLSAGLSAIVFTVANTVRGETERATNAVDDVRAYYLATGAVERAILYMRWGPQHRRPDGSPRFYAPGMSRLYYRFPSGESEVELLPEAGKLNLNLAPVAEIGALLAALAVPPNRAMTIADAIVDWRSPSPSGPTLFDTFYLSQKPSFLARHASFEEIEELLVVQGITPDLFYGTVTRDVNGRLIPIGGLRDCVTVYGNNSQFDVNSAHPAVLQAVGVPPPLVATIVERRKFAPFSANELPMLIQAAAPAGSRLRLGGGTLFTVRSTARLRLANGQLSDLRRSVAALVKLMPAGYDKPHHILRWYDNAWRN